MSIRSACGIGAIRNSLRSEMNEPSIMTRDLPRDRSATWTDYLKPIFLLALLLSTWVPMAFFLLSSRFESSWSGFGGMRTALLFLGTAHVPATLFFYIDKDFSHIVRKHKARYIYFPVLLTISTGLLFAFATLTVQGFILLIFWGWQAFHYGRQNTGIYSFVSIATRGAPADKYERIMI